MWSSAAPRRLKHETPPPLPVSPPPTHRRPITVRVVRKPEQSGLQRDGWGLAREMMDELSCCFVSYHAERVTMAMAAAADRTAGTPLDPSRKDESAVTSAHCRVTDSSCVEENTFFFFFFAHTPKKRRFLRRRPLVIDCKPGVCFNY